MTREHQVIESVSAVLLRVPTDDPESDGTLEWDHTDLAWVEVRGDGNVGVGWTYASSASLAFVKDLLAHVVVGRAISDVTGAWTAMCHALRNAGLPGAGMMAVSAVDVALWDLKARTLGISVVDLLGAARNDVELYGSGGFTSYSDAQLSRQFGVWAAEGFRQVKMKVGRDAERDPRRVAAARAAVGPGVGLFADANGAYSVAQAREMAERFASESNVKWFEEPRPSDDLPGLRAVRRRAPGGMEVAAGEYGDTLVYFRRMIDAGAVDCLQADATRCGGFTGFLKVSALCEAANLPLSAHCAPQLHAHVGCASAPLRHVEYFHDHARIASMLFEEALRPIDGKLRPDRSLPGLGISLRHADAAKFRVA